MFKKIYSVRPITHKFGSYFVVFNIQNPHSLIRIHTNTPIRYSTVTLIPLTEHVFHI